MSVPYPDPIVIAILAELFPALEDRVSTDLDSVLPAARITKVGDREDPSPVEITPLFQVEIWGTDEFETGQIAWDIYNRWPSVRREVVLDALVYARWSATTPTPLPDDDTDFSRHVITVGIRLSGVNV